MYTHAIASPVSPANRDLVTVLPTCAAAEWVALNLIKALSRPFNLSGLAANAGATIGLAIFPSEGDDAGTLLRHAELVRHQSGLAGGWVPGFIDLAMQRDFMATRGPRFPSGATDAGETIAGLWRRQRNAATTHRAVWGLDPEFAFALI